MRQTSAFAVFVSLLNLAIVAVALYFTIDTLDQSRLQSARTETSLNKLSESLDRLGERLQAMPAAPASAGPGASPGTAAAPTGTASSVAAATASGPAAASTANALSVATGAAGNNGVVFANDEFRDPDAVEGGSHISRVQNLPGNLNSLVNNDSAVTAIQNYLVGTLAERNLDDLTRYEPEMAESWEVSEDGLVYTIRLRKNIMWQPYTDPVTKQPVAAKPVTARDFLFYWETIQNEEVPCEPMRVYYHDLDRIEVVDDYTFKVIWKQPYSMSEAFTLGLSPLPEHYYRPDPNWDDSRFADEFVSSPRNQWIVGTGPYKLVKWDKNREVVLERDDAYYGRRPFIATRILRLIPDNSTSFLEFKNGALDFYGLQPAQWHNETPEPDFQLVTPNIETANADSIEWDRRKKAGDVPDGYRFEKYQYKSSAWSYIGYNMNRPLFADRDVRVALTHLVDRERILDEVYLGLGEIISGPFIPHSPYYNHDVKPLPFDIARASEILAAAGWEDTDGDGILDKDYDNSGTRKPFRFTFMIPSSSTTSRRIAAIVEQDMIKAKIKVDIRQVEWSVYTQLLDEREYDVCCLGWTGGVEGDPYQVWHGSGVNRPRSSNHVGYNSPEANRLIEEGRRTLDKPTRYKIYNRLHEVIAHDQPYTFLVAQTAVLAQSKKFRNAIVYKGGQMSSALQWIPRELQVQP
ncbi:MAG: peptide-binding protein [Planctomycetaceae bacterium]|nr:peptide-binding protein [Planctomycetaceae bacterium]